MNQTEKVLFPIELPEVIVSFKDNFVSQLILPIDRAIQALQTASDPVIFLLLIILFVQLIRLAIVQTKSLKKAESAIQGGPDSYAVSKEIKDLKKELKNIQKSVQQLKSGIHPNSASSVVNKSRSHSLDIEKIIEKYRFSWEKREKIAEHILDYQLKLVKQVKKIKKSSRISSSSSKISSNCKIEAQKSQSKNKTEDYTVVPIPYNTAQNKIKQESKSEVIRTELKQKKIYPETVPEKVEKGNFAVPNTTPLMTVSNEESDAKQNSKSAHLVQQVVVIQQDPLVLHESNEVTLPSESSRPEESSEIIPNGLEESVMNEPNQPEQMEIKTPTAPLPTKKPLPPKPMRPKDPRGGKVPAPPLKRL